MCMTDIYMFKAAIKIFQPHMLHMFPFIPIWEICLWCLVTLFLYYFFTISEKHWENWLKKFTITQRTSRLCGENDIFNNSHTGDSKGYRREAILKRERERNGIITHSRWPGVDRDFGIFRLQSSCARGCDNIGPLTRSGAKCKSPVARLVSTGAYIGARGAASFLIHGERSACAVVIHP